MLKLLKELQKYITGNNDIVIPFADTFIKKWGAYESVENVDRVFDDVFNSMFSTTETKNPEFQLKNISIEEAKHYSECFEAVKAKKPETEGKLIYDLEQSKLVLKGFNGTSLYLLGHAVGFSQKQEEKFPDNLPDKVFEKNIVILDGKTFKNRWGDVDVHGMSILDIAAQKADIIYESKEILILKTRK